MIIVEDAEFSEFSLSEGEIAVPVDIFMSKGEKEPRITVYGQFFSDAELFEERYGNEPFSPEAMSFWRSRLTPAMEKYGLHFSHDSDTVIRHFLLGKVSEVNRAVILSNTRIACGGDNLDVFQNLTTHTLEMDEEDADDISAIAVVEDKIAAYATLNAAIVGEEDMEISVECAPAFRGQGFASSCAALLSLALLERGYTVSYKCRSKNAASAHVAEKVGFSETGKSCSFVCYRHL